MKLLLFFGNWSIKMFCWCDSRNLKGPQKSIQQREAEYNEARRRILGEGYTGADNTNNNATQPSPQQRYF